MVKKELIKEWFERGRKDIEDAEFLLKNNRSLESVCFHIQQGVEKYLKGFLVGHGWELEKIHDLRKLLTEAVKVEKEFEKFVAPFRIITRYYTESRYPLGYELEYTPQEVETSLNQAKCFIALVIQKTSL